MVQHRSNRGKVIDFQTLMAQQGDQPAVGNMNVNARGDVIGKGGKVVQKAEERARKHYDANPKSDTTEKSSLKGPLPDEATNIETNMSPTVKTAKAQATEEKKAKPKAPPVDEPDEFDAPEGLQPLGYKEVELPNGDIEMVPYYTNEDE
jgi:hypothetical protein